MVELFENNDGEYFGWLTANPDGFIVNTRRCLPLDYMILHRASCPSIREYKGGAKPGGFTERNYIKVCSNMVNDLGN